MKNDEVPVVSVIVLAYNHADTIDKCLEGIVNQGFEQGFEIILGEDDSNDGTRERCLDWEARFPDLIRLFLNDRKENIAINGKPTGTANWIKCLSACRGEFVAYCEGDDYWIDKKKISKQVNCFREEADVSICYHRVWIEKQGELFSDEESITEKRYSNIPDKQRIGLNDLVAQGNFIHTPSVMFRSAELNVLPSFKHSAIGDYLNYLSVASNGGRIVKLDGPAMSVYRQGTGTFSGQAYHVSLLDQLSCLSVATDLPLGERNKEILAKRRNVLRAELNRYCREILEREPGLKQLLGLVWKKFIRKF